MEPGSDRVVKQYISKRWLKVRENEGVVSLVLTGAPYFRASLVLAAIFLSVWGFGSLISWLKEYEGMRASLSYLLPLVGFVLIFGGVVISDVVQPYRNTVIVSIDAKDLLIGGQRYPHEGRMRAVVRERSVLATLNSGAKNSSVTTILTIGIDEASVVLENPYITARPRRCVEKLQERLRKLGIDLVIENG